MKIVPAVLIVSMVAIFIDSIIIVVNKVIFLNSPSHTQAIIYVGLAFVVIGSGVLMMRKLKSKSQKKDDDD